MKKILIISILTILGSTLLIGCQSSETQVKNNIPKLELGTPFEVKTENGDYYLTIDSIKTTEERNDYSDENPKQVVVVEYTYKNKSFVGKNNNKLLLAREDSFTVLDGEGNVLRLYPVAMDKSPQDVPVGGKCTATAAYAVPTDSKTIKLQFERGQNEVVAEMVTETK